MTEAELQRRTVEELEKKFGWIESAPIPEEPEGDQAEISTKDAWPEPMADAAFHGLAGEIVKRIEPHTESDPAALLVQLLVGVGSCIGSAPRHRVEGDDHHVNLFAVMMGDTSKGRKGTSWGHTRKLLRSVDETWEKTRVQSGLSSGEGLIWSVRDPIEKKEPIKAKGIVTDYQSVIIDEGIEDKRLLVCESEFASTLRVSGRDGNTLSATVRNAWDSGNLRILTKQNAASATGAHVSIIGHITSDELRRYLDSTEAANGFANRFLWVCVKRSKCLPEGGQVHTEDFGNIVNRLRDAVDFARTQDNISRDDEAREAWRSVYPDLSEGRPGLLGAVTGRAEAQVVRLSLLYALLDCSPVIRIEHLHAALAVWEYCAASAAYVFGDKLGDPVADAILSSLRANDIGMSRTDISGLFGRNKSAAQISSALNVLAKYGLARSETLPGAGRSSEIWMAVRK